jgi:hypothetical protein
VGRKRVIVLALAAVLAVLGVYGWATGTATFDVLRLIGLGVVLAVVYVVRRGTLPDMAYRFANVLPDDDPRNLSPRIYLPILVAAILIAAALYVWTVSR